MGDLKIDEPVPITTTRASGSTNTLQDVPVADGDVDEESDLENDEDDDIGLVNILTRPRDDDGGFTVERDVGVDFTSAELRDFFNQTSLCTYLSLNRLPKPQHNHLSLPNMH